MKKPLLIIVLLTIMAAAMTQERVLLPKELFNYAVKTSWNDPQNTSSADQNFSPFVKNSSALAPSEQVIGKTLYDLQSSNSLQNRIYRYDDGCIGAVWTRGMDQPGFPDRGTGYNYYDGSEWGPMPESRIESIRTGWPTYAPLGLDGEIVMCHGGPSWTLLKLTRETRGIGDWTEGYFSYSFGPDIIAKPRIITAGPNHNSIHLIAISFNEYLGQQNALVYSRSQDGGLSWNIENSVLEETGIDDYTTIFGDTYVWADERNGTIAFLCGSALYDLFIMKSTDDGDTWEKKIIWEHPYPLFDWNTTITDTFFCVDNSASIALDSDGKAHVAYGISRALHDTPGNVYWSFKFVDGIGYWNEDMETFSSDLDALAPPGYGFVNSEMIIDYNYIGWMQDVNGNGTIDLNDDLLYYMDQLGPSTMPAISIDEQDRIFVLFASTTETYEYDLYNYKHIWGRAYENGVWNPFVDLTADISHIFDECIYPQIVSCSDQNIHYIYNADGIPGLGCNDFHNYIENRIFYAATPKSDFGVGVGLPEDNHTVRQALEVYPNPVDGILILNYYLNTESLVKVQLVDGRGSIIEIRELGSKHAGRHLEKFNLSHLPEGVYLLKLQAGNVVETDKIIIQK
ncbi:MAG: T9SS type A sorting domain-containing protein [Bacteroidetes bacterium]|nr:T9SS type A sorting domain-containing protein [Bacteroidota bacterium]